MEDYPAPSMSSQEREMHVGFMREALAMAQHALSTAETPVGCVFVHEPSGRIIGRGQNDTNRSYNGTRHAEFLALNDILSRSVPIAVTSLTPQGGVGKQQQQQQQQRRRSNNYPPGVLRECALYVTVEPCIMCASLLRQVGVRRVFYGAGNEKFGGTGGVLRVHEGNGRARMGAEEEEEIREGRDVDDGDGCGGKKRQRDGDVDGAIREREGDYQVSGGWLREECIVILRRFYVQENERAPEEKRSKEGRVLKLDVEPIRRLADGGGGGG